MSRPMVLALLRCLRPANPHLYTDLLVPFSTLLSSPLAPVSKAPVLCLGSAISCRVSSVYLIISPECLPLHCSGLELAKKQLMENLEAEDKQQPLYPKGIFSWRKASTYLHHKSRSRFRLCDLSSGSRLCNTPEVTLRQYLTS